MIKQQRRGPLGWHPHKTGSNPSFSSHAFFSPFSSFNSICYFGVPFYSWLLDLCLLVFSSLKGKSAKKNSLLLHYRLLSTYCLCHASTFCTSPLSLHPPPAPPLQEKHYYFLLVSEGTGAQRGWMKSWSSQSSEGATLVSVLFLLHQVLPSFSLMSGGDRTLKDHHPILGRFVSYSESLSFKDIHWNISRWKNMILNNLKDGNR